MKRHSRRQFLSTTTVLEFDSKAETITNSKGAHAMLTKEYREPYGLPSRV